MDLRHTIWISWMEEVNYRWKCPESRYPSRNGQRIYRSSDNIMIPDKAGSQVPVTSNKMIVCGWQGKVGLGQCERYQYNDRE